MQGRMGGWREVVGRKGYVWETGKESKLGVLPFADIWQDTFITVEKN